MKNKILIGFLIITVATLAWFAWAYYAWNSTISNF